MEKKEWCMSRMAFFVDENKCLHVQGKEDSRYGKEWMAEDFGINDYCNYVRGHITDGEISFFKGDNYMPIEKNLILNFVEDIIPYYKINFNNDVEISITNGKIVGGTDKNWTPLEIVGTICLPCESIVE